VGNGPAPVDYVSTLISPLMLLVSPSPSLSHCVSHCVSPSVSLTVSFTVSPSRLSPTVSLSLSLSLGLPPQGEAEAEKAGRAWVEYARRNDSPVTDLFCGQLQSNVRCHACDTTFTCYDPFWDLSVPIPKVCPLSSLQLSTRACGFWVRFPAPFESSRASPPHMP
jgi:hypothetical protein